MLNNQSKNKREQKSLQKNLHECRNTNDKYKQDFSKQKKTNLYLFLLHYTKWKTDKKYKLNNYN